MRKTDEVTNMKFQYLGTAAAEGIPAIFCECENCMKRKRSEHMRWNAYTMTLGYVRGSYRADRAKVHNKLCAWDDLSKIDKHKN